MVEIDAEKERAKHQAELSTLAAQLQQLEQQRAALIRAIYKEQDIMSYLDSLNEHKDVSKKEAKVGKQN